MRLKNILNVICYILFLSCGDNTIRKNTPEGLIIREYYPNRKIKREGIYLNDTIKNGWYKEYSQKGNLKVEGRYLNGLRDGKFIYFDSTGHIESIFHYKNDLAEGKATLFYPSLEKKEETFWKADKEIGESKYYYPNGKLEKYAVTDFQGNTRYISRYDETGALIKEEGFVIAQVYTSQPLDSILVGEEITREIIAAQPPDYKTLVFMGEIDEKGKISKLEQCQFNEYVFIYKRIFNKEGKFRLATIGEMKNLKTNLIKHDTIFSKITVSSQF